MDLISKLGRVNLKLCLGIAGVQLIGYALYKAIKTAVFSKLLKVSFKKWEYWPVLWWLAISNYCFLKPSVYLEFYQVDQVSYEMLQSL